MMAIQEENKKWNYEYKTLLLDVRLEMESEFRIKRKKHVDLWQQVLRCIKETDPTFPFSRDEIHRKFLNFMVTYKRIKKRHRTSGEEGTTWDFYDRLDKIYGCRNDIDVSESSLETIMNDNFVDLTADYSEPCVSHTHPTQDDTSPSPRKRNRTDIVEFLRKESEADRKLLKELLNCEKEKLRIEREKIEEIRKLREALTAHRY